LHKKGANTLKLRKRILSFLLAAVFAAAAFAGCAGRGEDDTSSRASGSSASKAENSTTGTVGDNTPDFTEAVQDLKQENADTVGWLYVYNTDIDDVVVCNTEDNKYYYRLNFYKEPEFNGVYWADRRSVFGDGSREQIGVNTCIYGHAMTDNPESDRYKVKFGPLHDFRDPEQAKNFPYIFFSTENGQLAYEVFAVFTVNSDNRDVPYNYEPEDPKAFVQMVREQILPRSKYNYNVEIKDDDKFLTLSTCIYTLDDGTVTGYPDTYIRYAIMGRLCDPDEPMKDVADFTLNENPLVDPDGPMAS
jgi:sortase B